VVDSFGSLSEPCHIRRENLEDSLLLYTFYRDIDDEMSWIRDRRPIAAMTDLGSNLQTVQSLQKKHQVGLCWLSLSWWFVSVSGPIRTPGLTRSVSWLDVVKGD